MQVVYFELLDTNALLLGSNLPRIGFWTSSNMAYYESLDKKDNNGMNTYGNLKAILTCQFIISTYCAINGL